MGDVVHLNQYRKERARQLKRQRAAENQLRFGRGKQEREGVRHDEKRRKEELDGKRLEPGRPADEPPTAS